MWRVVLFSLIRKLFILVDVGKTTVAVALTHLFGFGHTQSDDVKSKKAAPAFINNVTAELKRHDVVIADK